MSEKVEVTQRPATDSSIEEFARGEAYMQGGQHDLEDRGLGSGVGASNHALEPAEVGKPEEQAYVQTEPPTTEQDWKKLYGDSENEKGQWRSTAQSAMEELQKAQAELAAMRTQYQQAPGVPYQGQPPGGQFQGYPTAPQQPVTQEQIPESFFPEKSEDDVVEVKDVNYMLRSLIAPSVMQLHNQQLAMQQAQLQAQKAAAGITPDVEQMVAREYPWVTAMPEGPQKIQAMRDVSIARQRANPAAQAVKQQTTPAGAEPVVRRMTYIEPGTGKASTPDEGVPLQERITQEFHAAKTAFDKRKVLEKYGMGRVNDFGPDILTR